MTIKTIPVSFFAEIPPEFVSTVRHGKSKLPRSGQVDWTSQGTTYVSNNLVFIWSFKGTDVVNRVEMK